MTPEARRAAYASDITYVTNSELGFDYLRDNLAGVSRAGQGRAVAIDRCTAAQGSTIVFVRTNIRLPAAVLSAQLSF
jgi:hypothetical protein